MSYPETHSENDCDKCLKRVGKKNLIKVPFLYKDMNDKVHPDMGRGYRSYYVCKACWERGV
jgi:hypothetical protein